MTVSVDTLAHDNIARYRDKVRSRYDRRLNSRFDFVLKRLSYRAQGFLDWASQVTRVT